MTRLEVKVVPGASTNAVAGWLGSALKLRVTAPPEHGKANRAVIRLLSDVLGIPEHSIRIASGVSSPRKVVEIDGLSTTAVGERLRADNG